MKDKTCRICGNELRPIELVGGACGGVHRNLLRTYGYYGKGGKEYLTPKGIARVRELGLPYEHLIEKKP